VCLIGLTPHFGIFIGIVASGTMVCCGLDAMLRLIAGLTAIVARDKRSRADRALEILRLLSSKRRSNPAAGPRAVHIRATRD
jgi:hypothetical protein